MVLMFAENSRQLLFNSILKADHSLPWALPDAFMALLLSPGRL